MQLRQNAKKDDFDRCLLTLSVGRIKLAAWKKNEDACYGEWILNKLPGQTFLFNLSFIFDLLPVCYLECLRSAPICTFCKKTRVLVQACGTQKKKNETEWKTPCCFYVTNVSLYFWEMSLFTPYAYELISSLTWPMKTPINAEDNSWQATTTFAQNN